MFSRSPAQPSPTAGARDPLPRFVQQAESLREAGDLDRAEELLVRSLRDHGDDPRARAALARVLADRGDTERAEGVWRDALALDADFVPALRALADIAEAAGRRDEAMGFFRRLIRVENAGFDFGQAGQEPAPRPPVEAEPEPAAPSDDPGDVLRAAARAWEAETAAAPAEPAAPAAPNFTADTPDAEQSPFTRAVGPADPPQFTADPRVEDAAPPQPLAFRADEQEAPAVQPPPLVFHADEQVPAVQPPPLVFHADEQVPEVQAPPIVFHADNALQGAVEDGALDEWDDSESLAGFDIVFLDEDEDAVAQIEDEPAAADAPVLAPTAVEDATTLASVPTEDAPDAAAAIEAVEGIDEAAWSDESFAPADAEDYGFGPGFDLPAIPAAEPPALDEVADPEDVVSAADDVAAVAEAQEDDVFAPAADTARSSTEDAADDQARADDWYQGAARADEMDFAEAVDGGDEVDPAAAIETAAGLDSAPALGTAAGVDAAAANDVIGESHPAAPVDEMDFAAAVDEGDEVDAAAFVDDVDEAEPAAADWATASEPAPVETPAEVDFAAAVDEGDEVDPAAAVEADVEDAPIPEWLQELDRESAAESPAPVFPENQYFPPAAEDESEAVAAPAADVVDSEPEGLVTSAGDAVDEAPIAPAVPASDDDYAFADAPETEAQTDTAVESGYVFDDVDADDLAALDSVEAPEAAPVDDADAELEPVVLGAFTPPPAEPAADRGPVDASGWPTTARLPRGVTLDPVEPVAPPIPEPAPIATPQARPAAARPPVAAISAPLSQPVEAAPNFPPALPPDPALARAWFDRGSQRRAPEPQAPMSPPTPAVQQREPWAPAPTLTGRANPVQLAQALVRVLERDGSVLRAESSVRRLLAVAIGRELGLEGSRLDGLALAAVLADLGGLFLGGDRQSGRGTGISMALLESVPLTPEVHEALAMQHRRWDGSDGGPREDGIPFPARVLGVARDAAALLAGPAHRGAESAAQELQRGAGTTYDPMVVSVLRRVLARRERYGIGYGVGGRMMVAHPSELRSMDLAGRFHTSGYEAETVSSGTLRQRLHGDLPLALIVGADLAASEAETLRELRGLPAAAWMPVVVVDADAPAERESLLAAGADLCFPSSASFTEVGAALNAQLRRLSTLAGGTE